MLHGGLQQPQLAQVVVDGHHGHVALVAEHGDRHDLAAGVLRRLHGRNHRFAIEQRGRLAEQVQHANTG